MNPHPYTFEFLYQAWVRELEEQRRATSRAQAAKRARRPERRPRILALFALALVVAVIAIPSAQAIGVPAWPGLSPAALQGRSVPSGATEGPGAVDWRDAGAGLGLGAALGIALALGALSLARKTGLTVRAPRRGPTSAVPR
jgi:hypothetical protein